MAPVGYPLKKPEVVFAVFRTRDDRYHLVTTIDRDPEGEPGETLVFILRQEAESEDNESLSRARKLLFNEVRGIARERKIHVGGI